MTNHQNILIKYLKHKVVTYNYEPITAILTLGDGLPPYEYKAYQSLSSKQEFEVIGKFAEWGLDKPMKVEASGMYGVYLPIPYS